MGRVMNRKGNMAKMNNRNDLLYLISSTSRLSESFMLTFLNARDIYWCCVVSERTFFCVAFLLHCWNVFQWVARQPQTPPSSFCFYFLCSKCTIYLPSVIVRATIDLETEIRTIGENSIFLPEMKQHLVELFLFARLTSDHIFTYSSSGTICFSSVLFLEKKLVHLEFLRHGKRLFGLLITSLTQLNAKPSLQN